MATVNRITRRQYRVDFYHNIETDQKVGELLAAGATNWEIRKKTGATDGMIAYRVAQLKLYGVSRMETRNGLGVFGEALRKQNRETVHRLFIRQLNRGPQLPKK